MVDALIGSTGFIGSILSDQHRFDASFNSKTITSAEQRHYRMIVCAAAPGSMMEANQNGQHDAGRIGSLMKSLSSITADRFILISTIAVLQGFSAENEQTADFETTIPYGVNRHRLEAFVLGHFKCPLVLRLPALFGGDLRKNFLFDILNPMPSMLTTEKLGSIKKSVDVDLATVIDRIYQWDADKAFYVIDRAALDTSGARTQLEAALEAIGGSAIGFTNPASRFQYYDVENLWSDIERGMQAGLRVLHLSPAPLTAADVYRAIRHREMPETEAREHREDMRTSHAALWGKDGPYIANADEVMAGIRRFFAQAHGS